MRDSPLFENKDHPEGSFLLQQRMQTAARSFNPLTTPKAQAVPFHWCLCLIQGFMRAPTATPVSQQRLTLKSVNREISGYSPIIYGERNKFHRHSWQRSSHSRRKQQTPSPLSVASDSCCKGIRGKMKGKLVLPWAKSRRSSQHKDFSKKC